MNSINRNINIYLNSSSAMKELNKLTGEFIEAKAGLKGLKEGSQDWLNQMNKVNEAGQKMVDFQKKIDLAGLSVKQLKKLSASMRSMKDDMKPGEVATKQLQLQIDKVDAALRKAKGSSSAFWDTLKGSAVGSFIGNLGSQIISQVLDVPGKIKGILEMSDMLSKVKRNTGLTRQEVRELRGELNKIDTRTPILELLGLSSEAGKLGIAGKENILEFVKAADTINVALGEDLGADALTQIGKLVDVYHVNQIKTYANGVLSIGSAVNALGAASSANENYIVSFTTRMGGMASTAGIAITKILGMAGTLDKLGQKEEMAATAVSTIMGKMASNSKQFAAIAGMSTKDFKKLLDTDLNEAFIKVLEGLHKNSAGFTALEANLKDLGVDASRAKSVIEALSGNVGELRNQQALAAAEFESGNSIMNEYAEANENAAGTFGKFMNDIKRFFSMPSMEEWFKKIITQAREFGRWIMRNSATILDFGRVLVVAATAVFSYIAAKKLANLIVGNSYKLTILDTLATKASAAGQIIARGATLLYAAAKALLTGNLTKASQAMRLFNTATKMNPIGLLVAGITVAVAAYAMFNKSVQKSTAIMEADKRARDNYNQSLATETTQAKLLFDELKNTNTTQKRRAELIDIINAKYGTTLKNLKDEKAFVEGVNSAYLKVIESIKNTALTHSLEGQMEDLGTTYNDTVDKLDAAFKKAKELDKQVLYAKKLHPNHPEDPLLNKTYDEIAVNNRIIIRLANEKKALDTQITGLAGKVVKLKQEFTNIFPPAEDIVTTAGTPEKTKATLTSYDLLMEKIRDANQKLEDFKKGFEHGDNELLKRTDEVSKRYRELLDDNQDSITKLIDAEKDAREKAKKAREDDDNVAADFYEKEADKLLKQQKVFSDERVLIEKQEQEELKIVRSKYALEEANKDIEHNDKLRKDKYNARLQIWLDMATPLEKELYEVEKHYEDLIKLAKKYNLDTTALEKARTDAKAEIGRKGALHDIEQMERYLGEMTKMAGSLVQLANNRSDAEIKAIDKTTKKEIKDLAKRVKAGFITQEQADEKQAEIEEKAHERQAELQKEQFERNKIAAGIQVAIDTAVAVMKAWATDPVTAPFMTGVIIAAGVAAEAEIMSREAPEYGEGIKGGMLLNGNSHEHGGMAIVDGDGNKVAEVEGGEPIFSTKAYSANKRLFDWLFNATKGGKDVRYSLPSFAMQQVPSFALPTMAAAANYAYGRPTASNIASHGRNENTAENIAGVLTPFLTKIVEQNSENFRKMDDWQNSLTITNSFVQEDNDRKKLEYIKSVSNIFYRK